MHSFRYNRTVAGMVLLLGFSSLLTSCKKYPQGFVGPYAVYPQSIYTIPRGQLFSSDALSPDGTSKPFTVKLLHAYDASGNVVDSLFFKTYPVVTWTQVFDFNTDSTDALVAAKQKIEQLPA